MNAAEIARKALYILDRDGWCKHSLTWCAPCATVYGGNYPEGSHCIAGAWNLAAHGNDRWADDYQPLHEVITAQYPDFRVENDGWLKLDTPQGHIAMWNNRDETTEQDVRAILEKLACS